MAQSSGLTVLKEFKDSKEYYSNVVFMKNKNWFIILILFNIICVIIISIDWSLK